MKLLAVTLMCGVAAVSIAVVNSGRDYLIEHERMEMQSQQLQLDVLKAINANNEKLQRQMAPKAQRPSLELNLKG